MRPASIPFVGSTRLAAGEGGAVVELHDAFLDLDPATARCLALAWPLLDGRRTVAEVAAALPAQPERLVAALSALEREGAALDSEAMASARDPAAFLAAFRAECGFWVEQIFQRPFWSALQGGELTLDTVLGFGVEHYHFVASAAEHMGHAVASCRFGSEVRLWIARQLAEELDHADELLSGLAACGLDADRVQGAPPLASTSALIHFLSELAMADTAAYLATFGVMQQVGTERSAARLGEMRAHLGARYPAAAPFVDALASHAGRDLELGHEQLLFARLVEREPPAPAAQAQACAAVRSAAEHFILFFEGIADEYGAARGVLPRLRLDAGAVAP